MSCQFTSHCKLNSVNQREARFYFGVVVNERVGRKVRDPRGKIECGK